MITDYDLEQLIDKIDNNIHKSNERMLLTSLEKEMLRAEREESREDFINNIEEMIMFSNYKNKHNDSDSIDDLLDSVYVPVFNNEVVSVDKNPINDRSDISLVDYLLMDINVFIKASLIISVITLLISLL